MDEILVKKVRVLTPNEYDSILHVIDRPINRKRFLLMFWTGMRYAELQRFHNNPKWYLKSRNVIHIPQEGQKKKKRTQVERVIHPLPELMREIIDGFHKDPKPPTLQTWNDNLKRWSVKAGLSDNGISAKTTRKTIESWMVVAGVPLNQVYLRQGHNELTSLIHYQGLHFTPSEKEEIKRRLSFVV